MLNVYSIVFIVCVYGVMLYTGYWPPSLSLWHYSVLLHQQYRGSHFRGFQTTDKWVALTKQLCWLSESCVLTCGNMKECKSCDKFILWSNFLQMFDTFLTLIWYQYCCFNAWPSFFIFLCHWAFFAHLPKNKNKKLGVIA